MKILTAAALLALAVLPAAGQKLNEIDFFKGAVGIWSGRGGAELGPEKKAVQVTDVWKGQLVEDGAVFLQDGKVTLSEGGSFGYRWAYQYEKGKLIARYADSTNNGGICLVAVAKDRKSITLTPLNMELQAEKRGLFATVTLKDGVYTYETELRAPDGSVNVKTKVECRVQAVEGEKME